MKKILITGGAGFIGSNLVRRLVRNENYHIIIIDNFDNFYSKSTKLNNIKDFINNNNITFIEGDINSPNIFDKIGDVQIIIHLAAKAGVRPSIIEPTIYQEVNIMGTLNLLEYARIKRIKQFIFASSSSVYGLNENLPWSETEQLLPISPYASSKLSCEMLGHVYSHLYNIRFLALRFFTVYGPSQRPDLAIYKFFESILNEKPISIFGDGSSMRDYTYIDDIVMGIEATLNYDATNFEIFNLGNNKTIKMHDLISEIENTCMKKAILKYLPEQPGDLKETYANIEKAKNILNYNPKTEIREGLRNFYKWYLENNSQKITE